MLVLFFVLSVPAFSQEREPGSKTLERINAMIETTGIPGLSVTVMKNGNIVWTKGVGKSDLEKNVAVTPETRFRLASVSKIITAAALGRLVDDGKLDLDAPISSYVEQLPETLGGITARQLAGHLAGIRHYQRKDFDPVQIDNMNFPTMKSALAIFKDDPLVSAPGTAYNYSTFGFTLLAAVIQGASGRPFLEYMEEQVFEPLKLASAGPDSPSLVIADRTAFYMPGPENTVINASFVNPSYKWAGGGLLMNSQDLARFGNAHLRPGFLKDSVWKTMFISQKTANGRETGVGIAWRIDNGYFGNRIYHHEGSMNGARSALLIYPEHDLVVALLSNYSGTPGFAFETAQMIAEPFLDRGKGPEFNPAGKYEMNGTALGKDINGILEVKKTGSGYGGVFDFGNQRLTVVDAVSHPKGYLLVIIHKTGGLDAVPVLKGGSDGSNFNFKFKRIPN